MLLPEVELQALLFFDRPALEGLQMHSRYLRALVNRHERTLPLRRIHDVHVAFGHVYIRLSEERSNATILAVHEENVAELLGRINNAFISQLTFAYRPNGLVFPRFLQENADSMQCRIQTLNIEWSSESEIDYDLIEFLGTKLNPEVYKASLDHSPSDEHVVLFTHNAMRNNIKHLIYELNLQPAPLVVIPELFRASVLESCAITLHNNPRLWIEAFVEMFDTAAKDTQVVRTATLIHIRYGVDSHLRYTIAPFELAQRDDVPAPHCAFVKEWVRTSQLNEITTAEATAAVRFTFKNRVAAKKLELFVWTVEHAAWNWTSVHYVYMLQVTDM